MAEKHILVTNDDGVQAPSMLALVRALRKIGRVSVVAPDRNWSASGHVKTISRPLFVRETFLADGSPAYMTDGSPSDCVALAKMGIIKEPIDLVVSGINPNANLGDDITYSGTVTAAMEAVINGIPGVSFSLDSPPDGEPADFDRAAQYASAVVTQVLQKGLPKDVLLNVNIPFQPVVTVKGFRICRQGKRIYRDKLIEYQDPRGNPFYWIGGETPLGEMTEGTDYQTLHEGYVAITPLQLDLTAEHFLSELEDWEFSC